MSTKPSTPFTWATDATYVSPGNDWDGEPNKVAPASGLRAEGFEPASKPTADEFNHILNHIGLWSVYLDEGELEGPIQITGGELQVDEITDAGGGFVDFLGAVNVQGNLTLQSDLKHPDRVLNLAGSTGINVGAVTYPLNGYEGSIASTGAGATITWPIPLLVGDRIKSVTLRCAGDGVTDITALDVMKRNGGVLASLHTSTPAANTPAPPTVTVITANNTDHTLVAGDVIVVGIVCSNTGTGIIVYSVEVTYDRP